MFADPVALFSVVTVTDVLREYSSDFGKIGRALFWKLHVLFEVGPREMRRPEPFAALRARYSTEAAIRSFFGSATPTILKLADSAGVRGHFAQKGKAIEPLLKKEVDPLLAQVGMQWLFEFHCHHEEESEQRVTGAGWGAMLFKWDAAKQKSHVPFRPYEQTTMKVHFGPRYRYQVQNTPVEVVSELPQEQDFLRYLTSPESLRDAYLQASGELL